MLLQTAADVAPFVPPWLTSTALGFGLLVALGWCAVLWRRYVMREKEITLLLDGRTTAATNDAKKREEDAGKREATQKEDAERERAMLREVVQALRATEDQIKAFEKQQDSQEKLAERLQELKASVKELERAIQRLGNSNGRS